jgi:hypothetical protein
VWGRRRLCAPASAPTTIATTLGPILAAAYSRVCLAVDQELSTRTPPKSRKHFPPTTNIVNWAVSLHRQDAVFSHYRYRPLAEAGEQRLYSNSNSNRGAAANTGAPTGRRTRFFLDIHRGASPDTTYGDYQGTPGGMVLCSPSWSVFR